MVKRPLSIDSLAQSIDVIDRWAVLCSTYTRWRGRKYKYRPFHVRASCPARRLVRPRRRSVPPRAGLRRHDDAGGGRVYPQNRGTHRSRPKTPSKRTRARATQCDVAPRRCGVHRHRHAERLVRSRTRDVKLGARVDVVLISFNSIAFDSYWRICDSILLIALISRGCAAW